jgi:septal ring factor EnvC (AmiA/AmiB activator)
MGDTGHSQDPDTADTPDASTDEEQADPRDVLIAELRAEIASLNRQLAAASQQRDELLDLLLQMNGDIRQIRGMLKEKIGLPPGAEEPEDPSGS